MGGHNGCKSNANKCAVNVGGLTCGGKVSRCDDCEFHFCEDHSRPGIQHGTDCHGCDIGCDTTVTTKVNCSGKRSQRIKCKLCAKLGNNYTYCAYHAMPVKTLLSVGAEEGGGHVCQGYTAGAMLFGDNAGDLFLLACDMAVTVATAGSVNPAAATFAGNAMKVMVYETIEALGLEVLVSLRPTILNFVDKLAAKKREQEQKKLPKPEPLDTEDAQELQKTLQDVANALESFNKGFALTFKKFGSDVKNVTNQIEAIINALKKIIVVIDLGGTLQAFVSKLVKCLKKPVNPVAVIDAVKEGKDVTDKIVAACS